jgi:glycosyltransferase involved in cell wall biosynthesis
VAEAIDSILAQTFTDFELIISDNASTDGTEEICRRYADKDERIRYVRNRQNYGAAFNFNQTFHLSSGAYFKWVAHDDLMRPEFVQRCVDVLDRNPSVVLAYPSWTAIDEEGQPLDRGYNKWDVSSSDVRDRFHRTMAMDSRGGGPIWGLMRSEVLKRTRLQPPYPHGDHVLLAELSLYGRFVEIEEPLFQHRWHSGRYVLSPSRRRMVEWWRPVSQEGRLLAPFDSARLLVVPVFEWVAGYVSSIHRAPIDRLAKAWCYAEVVRFTFAKMRTKTVRILADRKSR